VSPSNFDQSLFDGLGEGVNFMALTKWTRQKIAQQHPSTSHVRFGPSGFMQRTKKIVIRSPRQHGRAARPIRISRALLQS